jgi:hypothetical protein
MLCLLLVVPEILPAAPNVNLVDDFLYELRREHCYRISKHCFWALLFEQRSWWLCFKGQERVGQELATWDQVSPTEETEPPALQSPLLVSSQGYKPTLILLIM